MTLLVLGLVLFLGAHSLRIVAEPWRVQRIAALGPNAWKAVVGAVSVAGFVLIVYGYGAARQEPVFLFAPPVWTRHLASLLTIPAFILLAAAFVPGTRIKQAVGHPMVLGVKFWALSHLIANGMLADLVLFGAFLVWAVVDYTAARRRDRAAGTVYAAGPLTRDLLAVGAGLVAWVLFAFWLHRVLIGMAPFG